MNAAAIASLLQHSSRTFALALPLLPDPIDREASLAYLLFRVADTLEDGTRWSATERVDALLQFQGLMEAPSSPRAAELARVWCARPPCLEPGYVAVLESFPDIVADIVELPPSSRRAVFSHAARTSEGMRSFLLRDPRGDLEIASVPELRRYCYVVAGIVGELLTDLFVQRTRGFRRRGLRALLAHGASFGEGLQLVNILRDEMSDRNAGRRLIPRGEHARLIRIARGDLKRADAFIRVMAAARAPAGVLRFSAYLTRLAEGTLDLIATRGPGVRLPREWVLGALAEDPLPDHETSLHA